MKLGRGWIYRCKWRCWSRRWSDDLNLKCAWVIESFSLSSTLCWPYRSLINSNLENIYGLLCESCEESMQIWKKFIDIYVVILPLPNTVENAISAAQSSVFWTSPIYLLGFSLSLYYCLNENLHFNAKSYNTSKKKKLWLNLHVPHVTVSGFW